MEYIEFGRDKSKVSEKVLGCMRFPELNPQEIGSLVGTAVDCGINMLDIADVYTKGKAESLLGEAFTLNQGLRDKIFLQSKCGIRKDPHFFDFSKEHIVEAVNGSLKRLNTDHLDALLLHRPDALMEPEEVGAAFDELYKSGKVLNFGVSNMNPSQMEMLSVLMERAGYNFPIVANQVQLSCCHTPMFDNGFNVNMANDPCVMRDGGILEYARIHDIVIQAWSVMQYGFFKGVFIGDPHYLQLNTVLDELADKYGVSSTAIAIAWILRYPGKMQAIIGTTRQQRVKESAKASGIKLTRAEWYSIYLAAGNGLP
ncbi:MAG TPA: aldo/keto reductase [Succinivibrionaceae bacterium]|nr:aldo/keto reductase [Succinivibrionaceae bacterium]